MYRGGDIEAAKTLFKAVTGGGYFADLIPNLETGEGSTRLNFSLTSRSLYGFMCLEAGMIMTGGPRVEGCANCGTLFMAGTQTGRRSRASVAFCSNKCRVAYQRKVAKTKIGDSGPRDVTAVRPIARSTSAADPAKSQ